ncbi:DUF3048 domain-containing protein [Bacillus lacus]|uniref:DUF3048 domain-containing protein n=1 Tax=Metabacillus lacus TaxID=1983721 RepID=A0A7X2M0C7_9BACI|nr:DUF3048 domain-containing protein [Metabacillus lacus]MRX72664.1 DUF3048 domain-containing protein [Metabacillus lacus]
MKKTYTIIMISMLFLLAGCKEAGDVPLSRFISGKEDQANTVAKAEKQPFPLTGIAGEGDMNNRPVAVILNNHPAARPQSGLEQADLIYEVLAEGGITRFIAIYQSSMPETVGPIRSARDYHIELANGYQSLFISHGWSPGARQLLESGKADYLNGLFYDGTLFWRTQHRKAPHNSYTSFEHIKTGMLENKYEQQMKVEPLLFAKERKHEEAVSAHKVDIHYGSDEFNVTYDYDPGQKYYTRWNGPKQTIDENTKNIIHIHNIFIAEMNHKVIDDQGRRKIDLLSGGRGLLLQEGTVLETSWKNKDGRILPVSDGEVLPLLPGRTWINIVPDLTSIKIR